MDRESALDLLKSQHSFPGPFEFRVVVYPGTGATVLAAMAASAGGDAIIEEVGERASRKGNYLALRVRMRLTSAEQVLEVYDILRVLDGVITSM